MTNAELIKALRTMDLSESCPCEYQSLCEDKECIVDQAADALEAVEQRIADLETALAACRARKGEQLPKESEWMTNIRWDYQQPTQTVATNAGTAFLCRSTGKPCQNATEYGYCKQTICNNCGAKMKGADRCKNRTK